MLSLEPELRGMRGGGLQRCYSCRSAPCAVFCRADAASLCSACDADVHSANPLARRHRRVPMGVVAPLSPTGGTFVVRPGSVNSSWPIREGRRCEHDDEEDEDDDNDEEAKSWLLLDPLKGAEGLPFGDALVADFLDLGGEMEHASSKECSSREKSSDGSHEFVVPGCSAGRPAAAVRR